MRYKTIYLINISPAQWDGLTRAGKRKMGIYAYSDILAFAFPQCLQIFQRDTERNPLYTGMKLTDEGSEDVIQYKGSLKIKSTLGIWKI